MKTIILRFIVAIIVAATIPIKSISQAPVKNTGSTPAINRSLNNIEIDESINWSRIGHKIYLHFANHFHRSPSEAKWTMVDQYIYATFKSNNKIVTVTYNKRGRWIRTVSM